MKKKLLAVAMLVAVFSVIYFSGFVPFLDLDSLRQSEGDLRFFVEKNFFLSSAFFLISYVLIAGLSLPFAGVYTLAGGALFGLFWGTILVSFGSSIGALCAFLLARYLFRDWIKARFKTQAEKFLENTGKNGVFYIAFLRLTPVFPFFLVNALSGLSGISALSFYFTSQICMLPATLIYVNAGSQLGAIKGVDDILSLNMILALALLGALPLIGKIAIEFWKDKQ